MQLRPDVIRWCRSRKRKAQNGLGEIHGRSANLDALCSTATGSSELLPIVVVPSHTRSLTIPFVSFPYSPPFSASTDGGQEHCLIPRVSPYFPPFFFWITLTLGIYCKNADWPPIVPVLFKRGVREVGCIPEFISLSMDSAEGVICLSVFFPHSLCEIREFTNPSSASLRPSPPFLSLSLSLSLLHLP